MHNDNPRKTSSTRAEKSTPAARTNMYFEDSTDELAEEPSKGNKVAAAPVVADTRRNDSSWPSWPAKRARGWWDPDIRIRCPSLDDLRRSFAAVNDQAVKTELIEVMKSSKHRIRRERGGHACDSLDLADSGSDHLDRHTSGPVLGT